MSFSAIFGGKSETDCSSSFPISAYSVSEPRIFFSSSKYLVIGSSRWMCGTNGGRSRRMLSQLTPLKNSCRLISVASLLKTNDKLGGEPSGWRDDRRLVLSSFWRYFLEHRRTVFA